MLVDYSATSDPSFQSFQLAQAAGVHFELLEQRLSLYYRYAGRRYPSAIPALSPEVTDDHRLGLGFNLPPVRASAEYQHHGSSVLPYDVLRGQQSLALPIGGRSLLSLQGSESLVRFAARGLSQGFLEATARYNLSAGQYLALSAAGGCRLQAETGKSTAAPVERPGGAGFPPRPADGFRGIQLPGAAHRRRPCPQRLADEAVLAMKGLEPGACS